MPTNQQEDGDQIAASDLRERILTQATEPIRLDLDGEEIQFRPASVRDLDPFIEWVEEKREPRELAVQVLQHQAISDRDRTLVDQASDEDLGRLLAGWAESTRLEPWDCDSTDLQAVAAAFVESVEAQGARLQAVGEKIREKLEGVTNSLARAAEAMAAAVPRDIETGFESLVQVHQMPKVSDSFRRLGLKIERLFDVSTYWGPVENLLRGARRVGEAEEVGFSRVVLWRGGRPVLVKIGALEVDDEEVVEGLVLTHTETDKFAFLVKTIVTNTPCIERRWPLVEAALQAHRDGNYALSVPVFMAQAEGVLTDVLVHKGKAKVSGFEVERVGAKGTLKGMHPKAEWWMSHAARDEFLPAANFICNRFSERRNGVLHGTDTEYAEAERSSRSLLLLTTLAYLAFVEEGED